MSLTILLQLVLAVSGLKTEHLTNPLGIDNPAPRFSWHMEDCRTEAGQTAYRITVATDSLSFDSTTIWDSGRIPSGEVMATYAGPALNPRTRYWWRVTCEDKDGVAIPLYDLRYLTFYIEFRRIAQASRRLTYSTEPEKS